MGRRPTRIAGWRRRCSRMGSGKRASMREGPLANLFRKTETEGLEPPRAQDEPQLPERATPSPQERLRHAFSEVPNDAMAPVDEPPPPSVADYHWGSVREERVGEPQL